MRRADAALAETHQKVQHHGDDHQSAGRDEDHLHILRADRAVHHAADSPTADEGRKDSDAYRVDDGYPDSGEDRRKSDRKLHLQYPLHRPHAHASGRFLDARIDLAQPEVRVPDDRKKRVERDADDDGQLARPGHDHYETEKSERRDGLQHVDYPEYDCPRSRLRVSEHAKRNSYDYSAYAGGKHHEHVVQYQIECHFAPPPFRPLGVIFFCTKSISAPRSMASTAAGTAPRSISVLLFDVVPW